jgi:hypothetical protein
MLQNGSGRWLNLTQYLCFMASTLQTQFNATNTSEKARNRERTLCWLYASKAFRATKLNERK